MSSAHGPLFCCKQLQEKIGVKVQFFIGLSQRTRTDFLSHTKNQTYLAIFYQSVILRTRPDFLSELLCLTMAGEVPLLDYITPIFYWTEVSAHGPIFYRRPIVERKGRFIIRPKFSAHKLIFTTIKNQSVWARH